MKKAHSHGKDYGALRKGSSQCQTLAW